MATILIVAEDPALVALAAGTLTVAGYEVFGAPTGKEALRKVSRRRFDLVLVDVALDGEIPAKEAMYGIQAMPNGGDVPVVAIADSPDEIDAPGLVGVMLKPLEPHALEEAVAQILLEPQPADPRVRITLDRAEVYEALHDLVRDGRDPES